MESKQLTWTADTEIKKGSVIVTVFKSSIQTYSYKVGFDKGSYRYVRRIGQGKISIKSTAAYASEAIQEAETYIVAQYQTMEDERISRKEEKERSQLAREKPVQKPGLKQISKMDKSAKYGHIPKNESHE